MTPSPPVDGRTVNTTNAIQARHVHRTAIHPKEEP